MTPRLETVACDVCGSSESTTVLTTADRSWRLHHPGLAPPSETWTIVECGQCSLVYLNPRPATADLASYYPSDYYAYEPAPPHPVNNWKWRLRRIVRRRERLWRLAVQSPRGESFHDTLTRLMGYVPPGRVLDVGCGSGAMLDELRAYGWSTSGVEISAAAARVARARGHDVSEGELDACPFPERSFDVVYLSHVLEHTPSPRRVLTTAKRLLAPGGRICIIVPNWTSIWRSVFRESSIDVEVPRHFYHFNPTTLRRLLEETGYKVDALREVATPRYVMHSLAVNVLDSHWLPPDRRESVAQQIFQDEHLFRSLMPFANRLESLGLGNQLLAVAGM
jgi:SAM-dependent methyltransferase